MRNSNASSAVNPNLFTPSNQERSEKLQFPIGLVFEYGFICIPFVGRAKDQTAAIVELDPQCHEGCG